MSYTWKNEGRKSTIVPFYWTFLPFFGYTARMPLFSRISPEKLWSPNSPSLSFVLIRTTTEVRCNKPILELWPRRLGTHFLPHMLLILLLRLNTEIKPNKSTSPHLRLWSKTRHSLFKTIHCNLAFTTAPTELYRSNLRHINNATNKNLFKISKSTLAFRFTLKMLGPSEQALVAWVKHGWLQKLLK